MAVGEIGIKRFPILEYTMDSSIPSKNKMYFR